MNHTTSEDAQTIDAETRPGFPIDLDEPVHLRVGMKDGDRILIADPTNYRDIADQFLFSDNRKTRHVDSPTGEAIPLLVYWAGRFWEYEQAGKAHREIAIEDLGIEVGLFLDRCDVPTREGTRRPYPTTDRRIAEVISAIRRRAGKLATGSPTPPFWLGTQRPSGLPSDDELARMIVFRNMLIHPPRDGQVERVRKLPAIFTPFVIPYDFDPMAGQPRAWLDWLDDVFAHDPEQIDTLQEFFGYSVGGDTRIHKALYLHGPRRSGKSTITRVLTAMLGGHNVCSPDIKSLTGDFGLAELVGKTLAIINEAKWSVRDSSVAVGRIKAITGQDTVSIGRKHRDSISMTLPTRFVFTSNDALDLRDDSGALAGRMLCLSTPRTFYGREDPRVEQRLIKELPSIMLWALQGLVRLRERGHFTESRRMTHDRLAAEEAGSHLLGFLRDCCEVLEQDDDRDAAPTTSEVYADYREWCIDSGIDRPRTKQHFVREMNATEPRISVLRSTTGRREKKFVGLRLREGEQEAMQRWDL